jgi:hypothetical protein
VIGARYAPNTPYINAVRAAERLGNAVLLTHEAYGHISVNDPSACVKRAISAYLVDLVTPPPGTICLSDHTPSTRITDSPFRKTLLVSPGASGRSLSPKPDTIPAR